MFNTLVRPERCVLALWLAAGMAITAATALGEVPADPTVVYYHNGPDGWHDDCPLIFEAEQDLILFMLDGTVLVDDSEIDPLPDRTGAITLEFHGYEPLDSFGTVAAPGPSTGILGYLYYPSVLNIYLVNYLEAGDPIGGGGTFTAEDSYFNYYEFPMAAGEWVDPERGYMGFYVDDVDGRHYGWADVTVPWLGTEATLHRFAYETTPGEEILAGEIPEPTSVALLALGATGVLAARKKH